MVALWYVYIPRTIYLTLTRIGANPYLLIVRRNHDYLRLPRHLVPDDQTPKTPERGGIEEEGLNTRHLRLLPVGPYPTPSNKLRLAGPNTVFLD